MSNPITAKLQAKHDIIVSYQIVIFIRYAIKHVH